MTDKDMNEVSSLPNLGEVREMIKRHKRNDLIFAGIGLLALMVGLLTLQPGFPQQLSITPR